jgi:hypothetical protein
VNNWTADRTLIWKTPHAKHFGVTPDISALLTFHFYEPLCYLDVEAPAQISRENAGYWLGVANNVGDALTFKILTDNTETVVYRSVVRSRNDYNGINKRILHNPNLDPDVQLHGNNKNLQYSTHHPMTQGRPLPMATLQPPSTLNEPRDTTRQPEASTDDFPSDSPTSTGRPSQRIGEADGIAFVLVILRIPTSLNPSKALDLIGTHLTVNIGIQIGMIFSTRQSFDAMSPLLENHGKNIVRGNRTPDHDNCKTQYTLFQHPPLSGAWRCHQTK